MPNINRRQLMRHGLGAAAGAAAISAGPISGATDTGAAKQTIAGAHAAGEIFGIRVIDSQTGRGVPLLELRTVNNIRYVTDSSGVAAVHDPGLLRNRVYFYISSPGYTYPKDAFGYSGIALEATPGKTALVRVQRTNIAERLYRITGEGIYSDSVQLGIEAPIKAPLLNGRVMGQDSCLGTVYQGRIFWIWGDTAGPQYPLGNFRTSGATSAIPGHGGLGPDIGINLHYFTDASGFCRAMCPLPGEPKGVVWLDGLTTVADRQGRRRLIARYSRRNGLISLLEHGLAVWNDSAQIFEKAAEYPLHEHWRFPAGHPSTVQDQNSLYLLFSPQFPVVRVKANLNAVMRCRHYEAFTCLQSGTTFSGKKSRLDRDAHGRLIWAWKKETAPVGSEQEKQLISHGLMKPDEAHFQLLDARSGRPILIQNGSFFWNNYLRRWIMIGVERGGDSFLGEIWFASAEKPYGPWRLAKKVATHPNYSFYNPVQNPFFDQDNGRIIYFQGTYSATFSGNTHPTPRYDYNQIMYRLDISDPRLRM